MITRIEVSGFKSLKDFALDFVPGLNILVGPNGAGKTNIVSFFEYLTHLMETDASEATSRVGGAGVVFRKIGNDYEKNINVRLIGSAGRPPSHSQPQAKENHSEIDFKYLEYDYSFSLLFPETRDSVLFQTQRFRFRRAKEFTTAEQMLSNPAQWDLEVESKLNPDGTFQVTINAFDEKVARIPYFHPGSDKKTAKENFEQTLVQILSSNVSLLNPICRYNIELFAITNDISGGQIYNVVPSKVKLPEDSSKPPGIARDGSGLAATLFALQRSKHPSVFGPWEVLYLPGRDRYDPTALEQLKEYLKLVNAAIDDIHVSNDSFDNQLRVQFFIKSGNYNATVPLAFISDGTLKWLTLVAAALTARSVFCIEEPENYLHPLMQGQIVSILREILFRQDTNRFTLMTTHSETLLNHCRPEEIIIVSMENGMTIAKHCSNAVEVSDEINRTGFGLGYYYISDALQNE
ncbi:MAG TPA: AAA family ATPase [Sedimentisphaerales bacterium]